MRPVVPARASDIPVRDASYVRVTLAQMWDEAPLFLVGGLLVDLSAVPAILIFLLIGHIPLATVVGLLAVVPAWAGYCYMIGRNALQFKPYLGDFLSAVLHYYGRSCLLGIPFVVLLPMVLITLPWLAGNPPPLVVTGITLQVIALLVVCMLLSHALPLLACFDLPLRQVAANSLVLVLRWPWVGLGLLSMAFLLALAARWLGFGVWLILPVLFAPFEVNATLMVTKRALEAQRERGREGAGEGCDEPEDRCL